MLVNRELSGISNSVLWESWQRSFRYFYHVFIYLKYSLVNSADDKLMINFLFSPENKSLIFHANCLRYNLHKISVCSIKETS